MLHAVGPGQLIKNIVRLHLTIPKEKSAEIVQQWFRFAAGDRINFHAVAGRQNHGLGCLGRFAKLLEQLRQLALCHRKLLPHVDRRGAMIEAEADDGHQLAAD